MDTALRTDARRSASSWSSGTRRTKCGAPSTTPGVGFIEQKEQKGTGHAVMSGRDALAGLDGYLMILYGDCPLLRVETLQRLIDAETAASGGGRADDAR